MALGWQDVQAEALRRIRSREWAPGEQIPNEADLARELGCARATVNRALRALAEAGWLERRRRAGTRVAPAPLRRAQVAIPLIRKEIENRGQTASHAVIDRNRPPLPPPIRAALGLPATAPVERVRTLYLADGRPFACEDRWVHLAAVPDFADAPLDRIDPNEWLVRNAPFDHGTLDYCAAPATAEDARHLSCETGAAIMVLTRTTFGPAAPVTHVRLAYAPGYHLRLEI